MYIVTWENTVNVLISNLLSVSQTHISHGCMSHYSVHSVSILVYQLVQYSCYCVRSLSQINPLRSISLLCYRWIPPFVYSKKSHAHTPSKFLLTNRVKFVRSRHFSREIWRGVTTCVQARWYGSVKMASSQDFYLRYYVGHKGKFGHEFLEFEFRPDGTSVRKNSWEKKYPSSWHNSLLLSVLCRSSSLR